MAPPACAPCLLSGVQREAVAVFDGASVCDAHLIQRAATRFGTNYERSRAIVDFRKKVDSALRGVVEAEDSLADAPGPASGGLDGQGEAVP